MKNVRRETMVCIFNKYTDVFKACVRYPREEKDYWFILIFETFHNEIIFWTILKKSHSRNQSLQNLSIECKINMN